MGSAVGSIPGMVSLGDFVRILSKFWTENITKNAFIKTLALRFVDPRCLGAWIDMCQVMWRGYFFKYRYGYDDAVSVPSETHYKLQFWEHYAEIRKCVPTERLLDYRLEDGWEPLCKFLERKIPDKPFPRVNESGEFEKLIDSMVNEDFKLFLRSTMIIVPGLLLEVVLYFTMQHSIEEMSN